jgi:hypothetical protein
MMQGAARAMMAAGICLIASRGVAQLPPPPPAPPPPPLQQPPPELNDGDRPPRTPDSEEPESTQRVSWYNGDYAVKSIPRVMMIDDPVTGFGNETLWTDPMPLGGSRQSDIAGSAEPD